MDPPWTPRGFDTSRDCVDTCFVKTREHVGTSLPLSIPFLSLRSALKEERWKRKKQDGAVVPDAVLFAHLLGGEVAVGAGAVPVADHGLGVERDVDAKVFGDAVQDVARHPQIVAHLDALARAHLELPLGRHDFGVGAADLDAGVERGAVVGLDDVAAEDFVGADAAVVGTLRSGEAVLGPAERVQVLKRKRNSVTEQA